VSRRHLILASFLLSACAGPSYVAKPPLDPAVTVNGGVSHRVGTFVGGKGLVLFEQSWSPATGEPVATLVVMHGLKDYSGHYAELGEALAKRGIQVRAFDLRGHGHSQGDRVVVDEFDDYVSDLDAFIARALAAAPHRPLFVFGHSMGGAIVTLEVLEHHPVVTGVILSGAALKLDVGGFTEWNTKVIGALFPNLAVLSLPDKSFSRDPAVVAAMSHDPLIYDGSGPAHTAAELLRAVDRIQKDMEQADVPLLILHGSEDQLTMPEGSRQLEARASSKDKTLKIYDGFYHDLLHEPAHDKVLADIIAWIDAHLPARAPSVAPAPVRTSPAR
jgi:alpha-beta hydrolase superfamily lysophospholipase